ncbi:hypothetical protein ACFL4T_13060 [candidate division KSB1 bacterium]
MKKENFEGFFLIIIFSCILFFSGCKSPTEENKDFSYIDENSLADSFGNRDGIATKEEIDSFIEIFEVNKEIWCIGDYPYNYRDSKTIPLETILKKFKSSYLWKPFKSETDLRTALEGTDFTTLWIGIFVLRKTDRFYIYKFYRTPGPRISEQEWIEILIK